MSILPWNTVYAICEEVVLKTKIELFYNNIQHWIFSSILAAIISKYQHWQDCPTYVIYINDEAKQHSISYDESQSLSRTIWNYFSE